MAQRGRPLPAPLAAEAVRLAREKGVRAAARELNLDRNTVRRYARGEAGRKPAGEVKP
jgi:hypothetical protein